MGAILGNDQMENLNEKKLGIVGYFLIMGENIISAIWGIWYVDVFCDNFCISDRSISGWSVICKPVGKFLIKSFKEKLVALLRPFKPHDFGQDLKILEVAREE